MTLEALRFALLADGRGDRALLPILAWLLRRCAPELPLAVADFEPRDASAPIEQEVRRVMNLFRPTLLFVHRDAETKQPDVRRSEIPSTRRVVKVVPVRMTEAWLLFDEQAIRRAADNPAGRGRLDLPPIRRVEEVADPKARLREALLVAADASGRQRKRFVQHLASRVHRVAELIDDYSPLLGVPAFRELEHDVSAALRDLRTT